MVSRVVSIDTNVLLRLLIDDVPKQHLAAVKLYNTSGQLAVADIAVMEVLFVLQGKTYGFTRGQIVDTVQSIIKLEKLNCNRALFVTALHTFTDHPALSFEDCCLAAYAELNHAEPLWTFDKKLANQTKQARLLTI